MKKKLTFSSKFADAKLNRFKKYFRYDNSKYWQNYYAKKLLKLDVAREKIYSQLLLNWLGKGKKVADVGCGVGFFVKELDAVGLKVYGVDIFNSMLDAAKRYLNGSKVVLKKADILDLPFKDKSLDCISLMSLVEHFPQQEVEEDILPSVNSKLKDGGYLFIHVPVRSLHSRFARWFRKNINKDLPDWAIDDDADITHKMWLSYQEYIELFKRHGFEIINFDFRLTRSNLKPPALAPVMKRLQNLFCFTDEDFDVPFNKESLIIQQGKVMKSHFALTAYFLFEKRI